MKVPLIDLKAQYNSIENQINEAIFNTLSNCTFIGGEAIHTFEENFKSITGDGHVISCANGTDSMEMILKAMGIGEGDEVIVPAHTWISTSEVVVNAGAKPIFIDITSDNFCINVDLIEQRISEKTKAIIVVHLYGHPAPMKRILSIAKKHHLKIIEDCAQAHGSKIDDQFVGTFGDAASFSFYPGKNLGCYGDGGAVYTSDEGLQKQIRMIANHGQQKKHQHILHGRNSRLDTMQAKILSVKLPYLTEWIDRKNEHAAYYHKHLSELDELALPVVTEKTYKHSWHLYVIRTKYRDELAAFLQSKNIITGVHYPLALPFQPCYEKLNHTENDFPVASIIQNQVLSLPMYAELTKEQLDYCIDSIKEFFSTI